MIYLLVGGGFACWPWIVAIRLSVLVSIRQSLILDELVDRTSQSYHGNTQHTTDTNFALIINGIFQRLSNFLGLVLLFFSSTSPTFYYSTDIKQVLISK